MRDHSKHIQISREEVVSGLLAACDFSPKTEMVRLDESFRRVLGEDVVAACMLPNVLTCRMDSIAVHWSDFVEGMPDTSGWVRGKDWEFANTGVAMPEGFDTAIVIEHVVVSDDEQRVEIDAAPSAQFAGTSAIGSRLKPGDVLAKAGEIITPDIAARIAGGNVTSVAVRRKPRVAFVPTGNELVPAGSAVVPTGKNIESNSLVVRGKVEAWGGVFLPFDIVPDDPDLIVQAVKKACACADIVVLNAGSSKGSDDWSVEQLEEIGTIICHQVNHGPAHHSRRGGRNSRCGHLRPAVRRLVHIGVLPAASCEPFPGACYRAFQGCRSVDRALPYFWPNVRPWRRTKICWRGATV